MMTVSDAETPVSDGWNGNERRVVSPEWQLISTLVENQKEDNAATRETFSNGFVMLSGRMKEQGKTSSKQMYMLMSLAVVCIGILAVAFFGGTFTGGGFTFTSGDQVDEVVDEAPE